MRELERDFTKPFQPQDDDGETGGASGAHDWSVPWSDLMMVMFVLFVVLFIYSESQQDVRVLFSKESSNEARSVGPLDPLLGLIGNLSIRPGSLGDDLIHVADSEVLYRSRINGVTVLREPGNRTRVILGGHFFFASGQEVLQPGAIRYLDEISKLVRMSTGTVHVVGYASPDESTGVDSFGLSSRRAENVARFLVASADLEPKRILITGRGAFQPQLPDTNESNMDSNRRVEILISNPR